MTPFQIAVSMTADQIQSQLADVEAELLELERRRLETMKRRKDLQKGLTERLLRDRMAP